MKKLLASSIIFSILIFAACTPQQVTGTLEVRVTLPSPTETPTPLPTPSPESLLPQEVKEKFETAGIDLKDMQNARYDKNGLSITLESGEVVLLTNEELEKNIFLGQDNVLQYRDESNQNVIYAYDKETGKWGVERPIKEFPWCKDMYKFEECVIDQADLQEHGRFAQSTLTEDLFDVAQLNFSPMIPMSVIYGVGGEMYIIPNIETAPNYKVDGSTPFLKNYMYGITEIDGEKYRVIQVPYFVDGVEPSDWPVITGVTYQNSDFKGAWSIGSDYFINRMNIVPWNISDLNLAVQYTNPKTGVSFTLEEVQAIVEEMKVGNFTNTNGLVLKFKIADAKGGEYR